MEYLLISLGVICSIAGILGCIFPAIPGTPLNYLALLCLHFSQPEPVFSNLFLIVFAFLTILTSVLDYILPLLGAKWYGISKYGLWGSSVGLLIGVIFFPPFGLIIGILIGAIIGELLAGKEKSQALKAGIVTFVSNILAMVIKLSVSVLMAFYFFIKMF